MQFTCGNERLEVKQYELVYSYDSEEIELSKAST